METVLFLAHTEPDGGLGKAALEALTAAQAAAAGGRLTVGLAGTAVAPAAAQIAGCGAEKFLAVEGEAFGQPRYATDAAAAEALCKASGATLVVAPGTSRWARALPAWRSGWAGAWTRTPPRWGRRTADPR